MFGGGLQQDWIKESTTNDLPGVLWLIGGTARQERSCSSWFGC